MRSVGGLASARLVAASAHGVLPKARTGKDRTTSTSCSRSSATSAG